MGARSILAIVLAVLALSGAACSSQSDTQTNPTSDTTQLPAEGQLVAPELADQPAPKPSSPRDGRVRVFEDDTSTYKQCDGSTLLYYVRSYRQFAVAAIPNSPECQVN